MTSILESYTQTEVMVMYASALAISEVDMHRVVVYAQKASLDHIPCLLILS